jgi:pantetheine-phosphate adenylyltransferase
MTKGIYAGSFDPPTNGHINVMFKASQLFDEMVIVITNNSNKNCTFDLETRKRMISEICKYLPIEVDILSDQFLVDYAKSKKATHLIRGIRNSTDYEYEKEMYYINKDLNDEIETIYILPDSNVNMISSSIIKSLYGYDGWRKIVSKKVPQITMYYLERMEFKNLIKDLLERIDSPEYNGHISIDSPIYNGYINAIVNVYSIENNRHYHTYSHVLDCIETLKNLGIDDPKIELAFVYHDYITNDEKDMLAEEKSAMIMHEFTGIDMTDYILATRVGYESKNFTEDHFLFADIDRLVLAADSVKYDKYRVDIADEYKHLDVISFYKGRMKVLEQLLNVEIFRSKQYKHLNDIAKSNIRNELFTIKTKLNLDKIK